MRPRPRPRPLDLIRAKFLFQSGKAGVSDISQVRGGMTGVPDCDAIPFDQGHGQAALFKQICRCYSGNAGTDDQDVDRNVPIQRWERFDFGRIEPVRFLLHYRLSRLSLRLAFNKNLVGLPANVPIARKIDFSGQRRRFEQCTNAFNEFESDIWCLPVPQPAKKSAPLQCD